MRLPDDSTLVARLITVQQTGLYASPGYLRSHGKPRIPTELAQHIGLVLVTSAGEQQPWRLSRGTERWEGLPLHKISANSLGLQQALAARDMGIVGLSHGFAKKLVDQGELERILPDWCLPPTNIWCVTPGRRLLPQRTLAFIEILKAVLGEDQA